MSNINHLNIPETELIIKTNSFYSKFIQVDFNLFKFKTKGKIYQKDIYKFINIINIILDTFSDLYPNQKMYFINNLSEINFFDINARNICFEKIKKWENLGGILFVGIENTVKIIISSTKYLLTDKLIRFFDTEQKAMNFFNTFLAVDFEFIKQHYKQVDNKMTWTFDFKNSTTKFYLEYDGTNIFTTKPLGLADVDGIKAAFERFKKIHNELLQGEKYYRIHDFSNFEIHYGKVGFVFIDIVKQNLSKMHLLIFCGLNKKNKVLINLGRRIFNEKEKIKIVDTIEDAYNLIAKHKKQLNLETLDNKTEIEDLPDNKEKLKEIVHYLTKENKYLRNTITTTADQIYNLLSQITWIKTSPKEINYKLKNIPQPFENIVEAIKVLHFDMQNLIISRNEELQKSKIIEERYRRIMQVIPNLAIKGYYKNLEIFFWNDTGEKMFGISTTEVIGKRLDHINICSNCINEIKQAVDIAVKNNITGEFLRSTQRTITNKFGKKIVIYSIHTALFDNMGNHIFFSMDFDLTKQYQVEEELRKHKENLAELVKQKTLQLEIEKNKAQESDKLKSAFLANMSHEIRTPMNTILGFTDLLENDNLRPEKQKRYIDVIKASGNTLLKIINDIIDISKIESGQLDIASEEFDLCEIIKSLKDEFSNQFPKNVNFIIKDCINRNQKMILFSDKYRIRQILNNFISNAIKFTEKGFVELSFKQTDYKIFISVKDTGIGLNEYQKKYIFNRFRQADETITRKYGGTGLGLAISLNLAKLMGGDIKVESQIGKGSTFTLILPLKNN